MESHPKAGSMGRPTIATVLCSVHARMYPHLIWQVTSCTRRASRHASPIALRRRRPAVAGREPVPRTFTWLSGRERDEAGEHGAHCRRTTWKRGPRTLCPPPFWTHLYLWYVAGLSWVPRGNLAMPAGFRPVCSRSRSQLKIRVQDAGGLADCPGLPLVSFREMAMCTHNPIPDGFTSLVL